MVETGHVAVSGPGDRGRAGSFACGFGESFSAGAGAPKGNRSNRAAARTIYRGADDRTVARANYCERGKRGELDPVFRGMPVTARDDCGVSGSAGNGEAASWGFNAGDNVWRDSGEEGEVIRCGVG